MLSQACQLSHERILVFVGNFCRNIKCMCIFFVALFLLTFFWGTFKLSFELDRYPVNCKLLYEILAIPNDKLIHRHPVEKCRKPLLNVVPGSFTFVVVFIGENNFRNA